MIKERNIKKIAVIGAGPSGLSTAYFLRNKSLQVELIESSKTIGGLAQSLNLWGEQVELGAHFLAYDECEASKRMIDELFLNGEPILYKRNTYIQTESFQLFSYPPKFIDIFKNLNLQALLKAGLFYFKAKFNIKLAQNAKEALIGHFGIYLYKLFFHNYTIKLWGKPCEDLDLCFYQTMLPFRSKNLRALIKTKRKRVVYFQDGIQDLWKRVYNNCLNNDVKFRFESHIKLFKKRDYSIDIIFEDGSYINYDYVISTLPNHQNRKFFCLPHKHNYLYRDLLLVYLKVNQSHLLNGHCLYIHNTKAQAVRLVDFSHFPGKKNVSNIVLLEYWIDRNTLITCADEYIVNMAHKDIEQMKLNISYEDFFIKRIPNAYRIPELGITKTLNQEKQDFDDKLFLSIGRSNSPFFNYGMDNAIHEAYEVSKKF